MSPASLPHGVPYYLHDFHREQSVYDSVKRRYGAGDEKYSVVGRGLDPRLWKDTVSYYWPVAEPIHVRETF